MTTAAPAYRPAPARSGDDRFVPLAAELGARFAERAAEHDRDNTFVEESYALLRAARADRQSAPLSRQPERDRASDASAAACDDRHLARQSQLHVRTPC